MRWFKKCTLPAIASLALMSSSCLGPNNAFENLHDWNRNLHESKWVNELVFVGLTIIPVYGLFYLGDIVIFNSIEFWGGENPVERSS